MTALCAVVALCVASAAATERYVPAQYVTIQGAIDACVAGDEVIIADGTYTGAGNKNLDFKGLAITVRSASGDPATCIIDCEGSGRGFYFHSGETAESAVRGLTIQNGNVTTMTPGGGGGVYCDSVSPILTNCAIVGNGASLGGGVYCYSGTPTLIDCVIVGNVTTYTYGTGGGLYADCSNPNLTNCTINDNIACHAGGGVYCLASDVILIDDTIAGNTVAGAEGRGGGVGCEDYSSATLTNCLISGNVASDEYGAGGGVYCSWYSDATLTNCTVVHNIAANAGGMYCYHSSVALVNCILWANTPQQAHAYGGSTLVRYCDVQGGWSGTGNIDADPLFRDPDGPDDDPNTVGDNDYRLAFDSPCLDVGDNSVVPAGSLDLDGHPRIARFVVDMGAYEIPFGDLDCSGTIDFGDINPFVLVLSNPPAYAQMYPDCPPPHGDLDANGEVGFGDINPFVAVLTGGK